MKKRPSPWWHRADGAGIRRRIVFLFYTQTVTDTWTWKDGSILIRSKWDGHTHGCSSCSSCFALKTEAYSIFWARQKETPPLPELIIGRLRRETPSPKIIADDRPTSNEGKGEPSSFLGPYRQPKLSLPRQYLAVWRDCVGSLRRRDSLASQNNITMIFCIDGPPFGARLYGISFWAS